jgi:hypothetical protein
MIPLSRPIVKFRSFPVNHLRSAGRAVTLDEVESSAVDGYQRQIDEHYQLV